MMSSGLARRAGLATLVVYLCAASAASAQQRPLVTEDPEVIGAGRVLIEAGLSAGRDLFLPASGLTGTLLSIPNIGVSVGLGSIVELQLDGAFSNRLTISGQEPAPLSGRLEIGGETTSSIGDIVVATKMRLSGERAGRPAVGVRLATKLPTSSTASGLGLGTMDFQASLLVGKTVGSVRVVGNAGIGVLGDPTGADYRNVAAMGVSVARALTDQFEVVGEIHGRANGRSGEPPPGTEDRGEMRFGARFTRGAFRIDAAFIAGLSARDQTMGVTVGATYVLNAFSVP